MYLGKLKHTNGQRTIAVVDSRRRLRISQTYRDDFGTDCLASLVFRKEDVAKMREFLDKYEQRCLEYEKGERF